MIKLKLRVNDYVFVEKGGEIIPKITGIDEERRGSLEDEIIFPVMCPECNRKLEKLESGQLSRGWCVGVRQHACFGPRQPVRVCP